MEHMPGRVFIGFLDIVVDGVLQPRRHRLRERRREATRHHQARSVAARVSRRR